MILDKQGVLKKNTMEYWKYSYDDNEIFTNESNLSIK